MGTNEELSAKPDAPPLKLTPFRWGAEWCTDLHLQGTGSYAHLIYRDYLMVSIAVMKPHDQKQLGRKGLISLPFT